MIDGDVLERVLSTATRRGAAFAEVFAEDRRSTGFSFDEGRVDQVTSGRDRGAGVRVVVGDTTGYAHNADLSEASLVAAAAAAGSVTAGSLPVSIVRRSSVSGRLQPWQDRPT